MQTERSKITNSWWAQNSTNLKPINPVYSLPTLLQMIKRITYPEDLVFCCFNQLTNHRVKMVGKELTIDEGFTVQGIVRWRGRNRFNSDEMQWPREGEEEAERRWGMRRTSHHLARIREARRRTEKLAPVDRREAKAKTKMHHFKLKETVRLDWFAPVVLSLGLYKEFIFLYLL